MAYLPIGPATKANSVSVQFATDALYSEVTPAAQATTSNVYADVVGSTVDMALYKSLSFTLINAAETITYTILADNRVDFGTAVTIQSADILASGVATYAVAQAPYRYYKVQIKDKVNGVHGTTGVYGIAKA
jgi:hypothetical protein